MFNIMTTMEPRFDDMTGDQQQEFLNYWEKHLETESSWDDYANYPHPWDNLYRYFRYQQNNKGKVFAVVPIPVNTKNCTEEFECRPVEEMVEEFFRNNRPVMKYIGQFMDYWILWCVTEGRFRCDHNKAMYVLQGTRPSDWNWMQWAASLKFSQNWVLHPFDSYETILAITERCNALLSAILTRVNQLNPQSDVMRNVISNCQNMPEFVPFQTNRGHEHKQFRWKFVGTKPGGSKPRNKAAPSLRLDKHSVHRLLMSLHGWLPPPQTKIKEIIKQQTSYK